MLRRICLIRIRDFGESLINNAKQYVAALEMQIARFVRSVHAWIQSAPPRLQGLQTA